MSGQLVPLETSPSTGLTAPPPIALQAWGPPAGPAGESGSGAQITRFVSALQRFKWLILGFATAGAAAGIGATHFLRPTYQTQATIYISASGPLDDQGRGPIRSRELLRDNSWVQLLRSYTIADGVVTKLRLFLTPKLKSDSSALASLNIGTNLRPGTYTVHVDDAGRKYTLVGEDNSIIESGAVGDSIGRRIGLLWAPPPSELRPGRAIEFGVVNPRDASVKLQTSLQATLPLNSSFMLVTLDGDDPQLTAETLNAWIEDFVRLGTDLKRRNLVEFAKILEGQLLYSEQALAESERALETFRVNTITLPQEGKGLAITPGLVQTQDPVMSSFYNQKTQLDDIRRDRESLERLLSGPRPIPTDALLSIQSVATGDAGSNLRTAVNDLFATQARLRAARQFYTDDYKTVRDLDVRVRETEQQTIPRLATDFLNQLKARERDLGGRVSSSSRDLRDIPVRSIEESRRRREVDVNEKLYQTLKSRYEDAKLAEAGATADVRVLDPAVPPLLPTDNSTPKLIVAGLGGGLVFGLVLAILLDKLDRRFRYPEQATNDLGLGIFGAVPTLRQANPSAEDAAQMVEAFRAVRLNLRHAFPAHEPMEITITSPGAGDGKSLISSNLALSLAEGGQRVLIIDGDIRRGELHTTFGVDQSPGLLDYLTGAASEDEIVRETTYENLYVIPCGTRRRRGPELLSSPAVPALLAQLRGQFDAIIIDSAPLGAGIDAYALGAATRNMLLVLRAGKTDRKLAQAKLGMVDRLPVRMLGAVLNCIKAEGVYKYYSYLDGYSVEDAPEPPDESSDVGRGARATARR